MQTIKAFFYTNTTTDKWSYIEYTDLDELITILNHYIFHKKEIVAFHIGIIPIDPRKIEELAHANPGKIIASSSAKIIFSHLYNFSNTQIGTISSVPFFSLINQPCDNNAQSEGELKCSTISSPYADAISSEQKFSQSLLNGQNTVSDTGYLIYKRNASLAATQKTEIPKHHTKVSDKRQKIHQKFNFQDIPEWLFDVEISQFQPTNRLKNAFNLAKIKNFGDLAAFDGEKIYTIQNVGTKSVQDLIDCVQRATQKSIASVENKKEDRAPVKVELIFEDASSFVTGIKNAASVLTEKERGIWAARLGFKCTTMTLQEIGDDLGVTRERVRQIESKIYQKIANNSFWATLKTRLISAKEKSQLPLNVETLEEIDPWFEGCSDLICTFKEIFQKILGDEFFTLKINSKNIIAQIKSEEYNSLQNKLIERLSAEIKNLPTEDMAKSIVFELIPSHIKELSDEIWEELTERATWTPTQPRNLIGLNSTAENIILALLHWAGRPLHLTEIDELSEKYFPKKHEFTSLHNAAAIVGVLYAPGTYGLAKHCELTESEAFNIRCTGEEIIHSDPFRQWHSTEIIKSLNFTENNIRENLTPYTLNYALLQSKKIKYLGRMIWVAHDEKSISSAERKKLSSEIISLLHAAGKPLHTNEIKKHIINKRGIGNTFQISPSGNLIRTGPSEWGLLDRDINIPASQKVLKMVRNHLLKIEKGIHFSEIKPDDFNLNTSSEIINPILSIGHQEGISIDRFDCIYLAEWLESHRINPREATIKLLEQFGRSGISLSTLSDQVNNLTERKIPHPHLSQILQSIEIASYDENQRLWFLRGDS